MTSQITIFKISSDILKRLMILLNLISLFSHETKHVISKIIDSCDSYPNIHLKEFLRKGKIKKRPANTLTNHPFFRTNQTIQWKSRIDESEYFIGYGPLMVALIQ